MSTTSPAARLRVGALLVGFDDEPSTRSSAPSTTAEAPVSDVPPPPNSMSVTCAEYNELDLSHQIAVLKGVGATKNFDTVARLIDVLCTATPDKTIAAVLAGQ